MGSGIGEVHVEVPKFNQPEPCNYAETLAKDTNDDTWNEWITLSSVNRRFTLSETKPDGSTYEETTFRKTFKYTSTLDSDP